MNIAIFTDTYNPNTSGVINSINILEEELMKLGHTVYTIVPSKSIIYKNKNIIEVTSIPSIFARKYKNRIAKFYSRSVFLKLKELNIDIIHTQSEFSLRIFWKICSTKVKHPLYTYISHNVGRLYALSFSQKRTYKNKKKI